MVSIQTSFLSFFLASTWIAAFSSDDFQAPTFVGLKLEDIASDTSSDPLKPPLVVVKKDPQQKKRIGAMLGGVQVACSNTMS
eukprot:3355292-Rhodomonas_salina.3